MKIKLSKSEIEDLPAAVAESFTILWRDPVKEIYEVESLEFSENEINEILRSQEKKENFRFDILRAVEEELRREG